MRRNLMRGTLLLAVGLALTGCAWLVAPAPQAVLTATPTTGTAPLDVTFDLSASTGDITSWTLSFGDGTMETGTTLATVDHTYAYDDTATYPKTYTATLTVQDSRGRTSTATRTITVSAPATPVLTATLSGVNTSGNAPLDVTFTVAGDIAPATGPKIVSWELDYGDGNTLSGSVNTYSFSLTLPPRTYPAPGVYSATVTVKDADDNEATSDPLTINVTSPPPEITAFSVDTVNFDDPDPTLTITSGDTVWFDFQADPAPGRTIVKWSLHCPGSNVVSESQDGLSADPLVRANLERTYTHAETQTQSYVATLTVWDDEDHTDTATINVVVEPTP